MMRLATWMFAVAIAATVTGCGARNLSAQGLSSEANSSVSPVTSAPPEQPAAAPPAASTGGASPGLKQSDCPPPAWLTQDLSLAAAVRFPASAETYALDWNTRSYTENAKPFNVLADTQRLWIGQYTGEQSRDGYWFYSGAFDISAYAQRVKAGTTMCGPITPVYMLESEGGTGHTGQLVPALSLDLQNGEFLAFAPNQVITKSNHAGIDQYFVYSVKGVTAPF